MWQIVCLLAAVAWGVDSASVSWVTESWGDWTNSSNWDVGVVPGADDLAFVDGAVVTGLVFVNFQGGLERGVWYDYSQGGCALLQVEWRGPNVTERDGGIIVEEGSSLTGSIGAGSTNHSDLWRIGSGSSANVDLDVSSTGIVVAISLNVGFSTSAFAGRRTLAESGDAGDAPASVRRCGSQSPCARASCTVTTTRRSTCSQ